MFVVFIGPPGSGKGTQAKRAVEMLDIVHLSTGELLREAAAAGTPLGRRAAERIEHGELVPDEVVLGIVEERMNAPDCERGFLFDGFPRTTCQAKELDRILEGRGTPLDIVVELRVPDEELTRRMLERADKEGRADDTPETIAHRMEVYHERTEPLLDYYRHQGKLASVDGSGSIDGVFERVSSALDVLRV